MLAIKLKRTGKKHQASYRIVVIEKRSKLQGRFVDDLGWFDPHSKKSELRKDRIDHWIKNGAQPTATVHNLLLKLGVISGMKIPVHKTSKKTKEPAAAEAAPVAKEIPATGLVLETPKQEEKTEAASIDTVQG
ncbi:MAG: 30S ribosomal protein S16 [Patescibacteria group bacterium]